MEQPTLAFAMICSWDCGAQGLLAHWAVIYVSQSSFKTVETNRVFDGLQDSQIRGAYSAAKNAQG